MTEPKDTLSVLHELKSMDTNMGKALNVYASIHDLNGPKMAEKLGVTRQRVSYLRKSRNWTIDVLIHFCDTFKISIEDFIALSKQF